MTPEFSRGNEASFVRPEVTAPFATVRGVSRAVHTLFVIPQHDRLFRDVARITRHEPQPLHAPVAQTVEEVRAVATALVDTSKTRQMKGRELARLGGVLIQFTDYVPALQTYAQTPYSQVEAIYNGVTSHAEQTGRVATFADQLHVALQQTGGDMPESLWRLFITSRLFGRWLDENAVSGLPDLSRDKKVDMMLRWHKSLAACKTGENDSSQDVGGDTYYAWTHVLSTVAYKALSERNTRKIKLAARTFERGTDIMHKTTHRIGKNNKASDHTVAADYGNAVGKTLVEIIKSPVE